MAGDSISSPLIPVYSSDPDILRARDLYLKSVGHVDLEENRKISRKKNEKKGYAWWQWLMLVAFALTFGLANGADNAASTIRALPAMVSLSGDALKVVMGTLSGLGALMNFMVIMMAFPLLLKFLKENFLTGGKKGRGKFRELSTFKKAAIVVGGFFTLATSVGIAFFTFESVPTVIIGIAAVFGVAVPPASAVIPIIAGVLAGIQGISMFLMLFKDTVNIISNASKDGLQKFLMIGKHKPKTTQEHYIRAFRLIMNAVGVSILLLAGAFMIFGQASATHATLLKWNWPDATAKLFTGIFVYCIASLSHFGIRVCSANGVFGKFGDWLGQKIGYRRSNPEEKAKIDLQRQKHKKVKVERKWSEKSPPEKIQTILWYVFPITIIAMIANTIGNAFSGMRGDHLLHAGATTEGNSFHHEADLIASNPAYVHDAVAVGAGAPEIASAAINGAASATLVTYFVFACDLSDDEKADQKQRFLTSEPKKYALNPHFFLAKAARKRQFASLYQNPEFRQNFDLELPSYMSASSAA